MKKSDDKVSLADFAEEESVNVEVAEEEPKPRKSRKTPSPQEPVDDLGVITKFSSESTLDAAEKKFYLKRRADYLREFDLNKSSDIGLVHRIVMEEIFGERLYQLALENPKMNLSKELESSAARYQKLLDGLGASRDRRLKNRDTGTSISIADLAFEYSASRKRDYEAQKPKVQAEDEALLREQEQVLGVQYEAVAELFGVQEASPEEEV